MKTTLFAFLIMLISTALYGQNGHLNKYRIGEGIVFSGDNGGRIKLNGYLQPFYEAKSYTNDSLDVVYNRFRMRRVRLRLTGNLPQKKIDYKLQVDLSGVSESGDQSSSYLMDAWVAYNPTKRIKIKFGQSSSHTDNRELTMGSQTLQLPERSRLTSSFATIREFGIFASGTFRTGDGTYLKPYLSITNGDGLNALTKDHGGLKIGGRLDFLPFGLFTYFGQFRQADVIGELTPKLVLGINYSINHGMSSRRGRESGAILYLNDQLQESLADYSKYGFDFLLKYKGISMLGEWVKTSATVPDDIAYRVRVDGTTATTFDVNGTKDVANYVKGRMMLGEAYNLQMGYVHKRKYAIDARYTHIKADEFSFLNNGLFYNRPNYYTLGLSRYFSKNYGFKMQASITYVELAPNSRDIYSNPVDGHEWITRLIATISF